MLSKAFSRLVSPALLSLLAIPAFADSAVRIVRLSYIENEVEIDRGTGKYDNAMVNLPITAGTKLRTGSSGLAEVEFEDESTIRLAPSTALEITQLWLKGSGEKVSTAKVVSGTTYVNFSGRQQNALTLEFGSHSVVLTRSTRLRIGVEPRATTVAVFKGAIRIEGSSGAQEVNKNQTAKLDVLPEVAPALVKSIDRQPYDEWAKMQDDYHSRNHGTFGSPASDRYGVADLAYYGDFFNAPGYGLLWQPYFTGMGWNPFMDGAWVSYPGSGFTWVSAYPWGWMPFHSGSWVFLSGSGWAWQPGTAWTNWYSQPSLQNAPAGFAVPRPPASGTTTQVVSRAPASATTNVTPGKLAVRSNSASLGVPRGSIRNLAPVSEQVQNRPIAARTFNPGDMSPAAYSVESSSSNRAAQGTATPAPVHGPAGAQPHK